ncbi:hypothetical protein WCQ02_29215 [Paraburkholderia tropica]|uniref:hypothetical protein n=1 Tax=Paraburkholderia tropica TaxID=92647 RepID=UPI003017AA80
MPYASETAEERFRQAFERLKLDRPQIMSRGTPVSQNNVAREAGTDPTALRKARYPALVREIQAYIEIHSQEKVLRQERSDRRRKREDLKGQVALLTKQRDRAQSQLASAHRIVLTLLQENAALTARLEDMTAPPTPLRK